MNIHVVRDGKVVRGKMPAGWSKFLMQDAPAQVSEAIGLEVSGLLELKNLVVARELNPVYGKEGPEGGYCDYGIGARSTGPTGFGGLPWDCTLAVSDPAAYAHEFGHYLHLLSRLDFLYYGGPEDGLPDAVRRLIRDSINMENPDVQADDYLARPDEVFARLFETHVAWRFYVNGVGGSSVAHDFDIYREFDNGDGVEHFLGYAHAWAWGEKFDRRFHRAVRDMIRRVSAHVAAYLSDQ
jgi:hypothetical protein